MDQIELVSLKCLSCSARETKTWAEILEFLRQEGRLRREAKPELACCRGSYGDCIQATGIAMDAGKAGLS